VEFGYIKSADFCSSIRVILGFINSSSSQSPGVADRRCILYEFGLNWLISKKSIDSLKAVSREIMEGGFRNFWTGVKSMMDITHSHLRAFALGSLGSEGWNMIGETKECLLASHFR
jgi:hypothetical protein